jgi:hypothetical protein
MRISHVATLVTLLALAGCKAFVPTGEPNRYTAGNGPAASGGRIDPLTGVTGTEDSGLGNPDGPVPDGFAPPVQLALVVARPVSGGAIVLGAPDAARVDLGIREVCAAVTDPVCTDVDPASDGSFTLPVPGAKVGDRISVFTNGPTFAESFPTAPNAVEVFVLQFARKFPEKVHDLYETPGHLFIGGSGGLYRIAKADLAKSPEAMPVHRFSVADGLPAPDVYRIQPAPNGALWLASEFSGPLARLRNPDGDPNGPAEDRPAIVADPQFEGDWSSMVTDRNGGLYRHDVTGLGHLIARGDEVPVYQYEAVEASRPYARTQSTCSTEVCEEEVFIRKTPILRDAPPIEYGPDVNVNVPRIYGIWPDGRGGLWAKMQYLGALGGPTLSRVSPDPTGASLFTYESLWLPINLSSLQWIEAISTTEIWLRLGQSISICTLDETALRLTCTEAPERTYSRQAGDFPRVTAGAVWDLGMGYPEHGFVTRYVLGSTAASRFCIPSGLSGQTLWSDGSHFWFGGSYGFYRVRLNPDGSPAVADEASGCAVVESLEPASEILFNRFSRIARESSGIRKVWGATPDGLVSMHLGLNRSMEIQTYRSIDPLPKSNDALRSGAPTFDWLPSSWITDVDASDGQSDSLTNIWVGTSKGVARLRFQYDDSPTIRVFSGLSELPAERVRAISAWLNEIWVAMEGGRIYRMLLQEGRPALTVELIEMELNTVHGRGEVTVLETGNPGEVFVGTSVGLFRVFSGTSGLESERLGYGRVSDLALDASGLWVSNSGSFDFALMTRGSEGWTSRTFSSDPPNPQYFNVPGRMAVQDSDVFFAAPDGRASIFDKTDEGDFLLKRRFGPADGISGTALLDLEVTGPILWVAHEHGLSILTMTE